MRILLIAVGRLKQSAEAELTRRYVERAADHGRALAITIAEREITEGKGARPPERMAREAAEIADLVPDGAILVVLDERGKTLTSPAFAARLGGWRDSGVKDLAFVIGGPDGIDPALRDKADLVLSFGAMTLPHQIARALVAEQVYRALTILSGHPYHRT